MKKVIFVVLIMLVVSVCYAQMSWEARIGANLSGVSKGDVSMKFGAKAGVGIEYAFTSLFAIRPALFFSMKGATDGKSPFDFSPDETLKLNYVEIPVLASFRFKVVENFSLALNAGPSFSCRLSKKPDLLTDLNAFDIGANMGLDFVLHKKFVIGVEGQYGLSKLTDKGDEPHNINYSLSFGYKF